MAEAEFLEQLETNISGVPSTGVLEVWDRVAPVLDRVVTPDTGYTLEQVMLEIHDQNAQLWIIEDFEAVVVTKVLIRPLHKALWVWYVAGDNAARWMPDLMVLMEAFAGANDCDYVEFSGRKGWAKYCKPSGYRVVLTTFRKDIQNG